MSAITISLINTNYYTYIIFALSRTVLEVKYINHFQYPQILMWIYTGALKILVGFNNRIQCCSRQKAMSLTKHVYLSSICLSHRPSPLIMTCLCSISLSIAFYSPFHYLDLVFSYTEKERRKKMTRKESKEDRTHCM